MLEVLCLLLPLIGSAAAWIRTIGPILTCLSVALAWCLSFSMLSQMGHLRLIPIVSWSETMHFNIMFDALSVVMWHVVLSVSLAVHIYSLCYMKDDPGYPRFFSYLSFFTFGMIFLVVSDNFFQLFLGWEWMGLASYGLIGFWFKKHNAQAAALKAFLVNRIGDAGLLVGIGLIYHVFSSIDYSTFLTHLSASRGFLIGPFPVRDMIAIALLIGVFAKSAQLPLHHWLPDSMEGPTPVSALIHAATMVAAGIYIVIRLGAFFSSSSIAMLTMLYIGSTGALLMGISALFQHDIKRMIAYSTLSQLGYMVAGLGAGAWVGGFFHLINHAFFKSLLFLCAGVAIWISHHEQNIHLMGSFAREKILKGVFLIGTCSMAGIPFFSGIYSKDIILEAVHRSISIYAYQALVLSAFFTSLYSFFLYFRLFYGVIEEKNHPKNHPKTPVPLIMKAPLLFLSCITMTMGVMLFPWMSGAALDQMNGWVTLTWSSQIDPWKMHLEFLKQIPTHISFYAICIGGVCAWYIRNNKLESHPVMFFFRQAYGWDALMHRLVVAPFFRIAAFFLWVNEYCAMQWRQIMTMKKPNQVLRLQHDVLWIYILCLMLILFCSVS